MNNEMTFNCCVCHKKINKGDQDVYVLQVSKVGKLSPECMKAHGNCLREVIPVVGEATPDRG